MTGVTQCKLCGKTPTKPLEPPSKVILKMLMAYKILCTYCKRPYSMKEIGVHETQHCRNTTCANELCGATLDNMPRENLVRFQVAKGAVDEKYDELKIACSKKCKKVARFGYIMKHANENEVLKAFESMMRKKLTKR